MKKILIIGLGVLFAVLLGGIVIGSGQAYAFTGEGFNGPIISPDAGSVAYDKTLVNNNLYTLGSEGVWPVISPGSGGVAFDASLAKCRSYAMNDEAVSSPVISSEIGGAVRGTEDESGLIAMLCN